MKVYPCEGLCITVTHSDNCLTLFILMENLWNRMKKRISYTGAHTHKLRVKQSKVDRNVSLQNNFIL